jgi:hypothetical protein
LLFCSFSLYGQTNFWKKSYDNNLIAKAKSDNYEKSQVFELDLNSLLNELGTSDSVRIILPNSNGDFDTYILYKKII